MKVLHNALESQNTATEDLNLTAKNLVLTLQNGVVTLDGSPLGGAAYPDNVNVIGVDTVLNTTTHQGIIYQAGGVLTLPSVAANGTTYKIIGPPNDIKIDTNTKPIVGLGVGTFANPINPTNGNIHLVALNAPTLIWFQINKTIGYSAGWLATRTYQKHEIIEDTGVFYLSTVDNNLNNALTDRTKWMRLGGADQQTYSPSISAMVNASLPTTFITAYKFTEGWVEMGVSLELTTAAGAGTLTQFEFNLPVASNLANVTDLIVTGSAMHSAGIDPVFGEAETTNETGKCSFYASAVGVYKINLIVRYKVV